MMVATPGALELKVQEQNASSSCTSKIVSLADAEDDPAVEVS